MAALPVILTVASMASTIVSAVGQVQQGNAARSAANFEADQLKQNAGQERAASQREAYEKRREARLAASRATALAAAGGGGVDDPTVVNILGDINAEGEYNAMASLYQGEDRARGMEMGASARRYEGAMAKKASTIGAVSTILSSGDSLMNKYNSPTSTSLPWQRGSYR